jgi:large subunit ribosomal protein L6
VSRIGKVPIKVVQGVQVSISPDMAIHIKGPKGELNLATGKRVKLVCENGEILVERPDDTTPSRAFHGLYQRLIENMMIGVTAGYTKELQLEGVGYRAENAAGGITLSLGYSHPIKFPAPEGVTIQAPENTRIVISGFDKGLVGQVAADIRRLRPPEPYKGKGIRYKGEHIRRKVGKTGA